MKVLVTGATGFVGSHLSERLTAEGHQVRALVRATSKTGLLTKLGAELHEASLETGRGLETALQGVDAVVHGAAVVKARSAEEFHRVNATGTQNLLNATLEHNPGIRRFVYVSSLAAHGFSQDGEPRAVDDPPRPVTHYGRSKLAGEQAVLAAKDRIPVTVIRPPAIYGPRDVEMFAFFKTVKTGVVPFLGSKKNVLSLVYGPDCADAIYAALTKDHPSGRVYFVDDGGVYTQKEMGEVIADALGVRGLKFSVPIPLVSAAAVLSEAFGKLSGKAVMLTRDKVNELREPYLICRGDSIREELGWSPSTRFPDGAKRTAEWYRSEGWL